MSTYFYKVLFLRTFVKLMVKIRTKWLYFNINNLPILIEKKGSHLKRHTFTEYVDTVFSVTESKRTINVNDLYFS